MEILDPPDELLNWAAQLITEERYDDYEALKKEYPQYYFATDERYSYQQFLQRMTINQHDRQLTAYTISDYMISW